ncbi:MAG: ribokinase, partial [Hyphomicrobiales bacterium]
VFVARVGRNDLVQHEAHFRAKGVLPVLAGDAELGSGALVTIVDPSGERSFLTDRGANLNLCAADLADDLLDNTGLVLISGYSFFAPGPRAAVQSLLGRVREKTIPIAIDPASIGFLDEVGPRTFLSWVGEADWLFANENEAEMLSGVVDFEEQMRILGKQFRQVVIKRGRFGAAIGGRDGVTLSRSAPIVNVVDSTGAGDAFAAGFVAALLRQEPLETCLEEGIQNGSRAVQHVGGQPQ